MLVALAIGATGLQAGQGGNCSPEGTWYGYNTFGYLWIITITRSGPDSYTTVMDNGANLLFAHLPRLSPNPGVAPGPGDSTPASDLAHPT